MDSAASVIAQLQLRYPSIRDVQGLMTVIEDRVPHEALAKQLATVLQAWWPTDRKKKKTKYQYVAGTLLVDVLWVARALLSFVLVIPAAAQTKLVVRDGFFGHTYSEEDTSHYTAPDMTSKPAFLSEQLPLLFNVLLANRASGISSDTSSFTGWFLDQFDSLFTSRHVTIHLVFVCIYWIRSVAALQGDAGLGRNVSLTILHRWDLEKKLSDSIHKGHVRKADVTLHEELEAALGNMEQSDKAITLVRGNPVLAGLMLLDHHFHFLHLGTEATLVTSHLQAFYHLYNALRDRRLLEEIPLVEKLLQVYERAVLTPSRVDAVHGSFFRAYLVSSHLTDAAVDAMLHRRPPPRERFATRVREHFHIKDLLRVFRLLKEKDYSVLPPAALQGSGKTLLDSVSLLCTHELFDSRVLSRDMLALSDDLANLFDTLGRRDQANQIIADGIPGQPHQYAENRALEDAVMMPLLPLLDCLNLDGTTRVGADTTDLLQSDGVRRLLGSDIGADMIQRFGRRAADVLLRTFLGRDSMVLETTYFSLPPTPEWSSIEFGDASFHSATSRATTQEMFLTLLEMMEDRDGPLRDDELAQLK